jgi:hypothetical protein
MKNYGLALATCLACVSTGCASTGLAPLSNQYAGPARGVVVAEIQGTGNLYNINTQALTRRVRAVLGKAKTCRLITPDAQTDIDAELIRQLSGGCNEDSCLQDLGGALGADYVLRGNFGSLGSRYSFNLELVSIATETATATSEVMVDSIDEAADSISKLLSEVIGERLSNNNVRSKPERSIGRKSAIITRVSREPIKYPRQIGFGFALPEVCYQPGPCTMNNGGGKYAGLYFHADVERSERDYYTTEVQVGGGIIGIGTGWGIRWNEASRLFPIGLSTGVMIGYWNMFRQEPYSSYRSAIFQGYLGRVPSGWLASLAFARVSLFPMLGFEGTLHLGFGSTTYISIGSGIKLNW